MARAVTGWSPVIITTLMPARRQVSMVSRASARGGSLIPTRPRKVIPLSASARAAPCLRATASTRSASSAICRAAARTRSRPAASRGTSPDAVSTLEHSASTTSGAPLE